MPRSLNAPLSPNEEITLRRVALGISRETDLPARALMRLKMLSLVELTGDRPKLTTVGRQRYNTLPRATPLTDVSSYEDFVGAFAERLRKTKE